MPADVFAYREIRLEALATECDALGAGPTIVAALSLQDFAAGLTASPVLGAYAGEMLLGIARYMREPGAAWRHRGELYGMYVRPYARGRGVGGALVAAIKAIARADVAQLHLSVVPGNAAALALYARHGFETCGATPSITPAGPRDAILMVAMLR